MNQFAQWSRGEWATRWRLLWQARTGRALMVAAALLVIGTLVGLIALWPGSSGEVGSGRSGATDSAKVVAVEQGSCQGGGECYLAKIDVLSGVDKGRASLVSIDLGHRSPTYPVGTRVRVLRNRRLTDVEATALSPSNLPGAQDPGAEPAQYQYSIVDYDRRLPLAWLAAAFGIVVVLAGRLRGLLSLVGLGTGILIVSQFVVPAMLAKVSPFLVALVGSLGAMLVTIGLTSGVSAQSLAAALGIGASLLFASGLGLLYVHVAHLNGTGSEVAFTLGQTNPNLSLQGLVLAGFVIGALGVLADMAVTQASAVMALRRANPKLSFRAIYREAFSVGRDHLSATVNTLVFAYVGASLPLLLLFKAGGINFTDAINNQEVAESVVATLVGAIGVVASVPLTTALATLLARDLPPEAVPADAHGHHH